MKTRNTIAKLFILMAVVALGSTLKIAHADAPSPSPEEVYSYKLDQWIDRIEWEESRGEKMLVILDSNDKYSYGCMQYQMDTWIGDSKAYGVKGEMMDCAKQKQLAKLTIMHEPDKGWKRWYNSTKKVGLPPRLASPDA